MTATRRKLLTEWYAWLTAWVGMNALLICGAWAITSLHAWGWVPFLILAIVDNSLMVGMTANMRDILNNQRGADDERI